MPDYAMASRISVIPLALLTMLALGACGTRPARLQPPSGKNTNDYPKTYPGETTIDGGRAAPTPVPAPSGNTVEIAPDADTNANATPAGRGGAPAPSPAAP